jgi:hypothetical protein
MSLDQISLKLLHAAREARRWAVPRFADALRIAAPKLRIAIRVLMFATPIIVIASLIRDYYPFPSSPRIEPGSNVVTVAPASHAKVYGEDFSVELIGVKGGPDSVTADFRVLGSHGTCRFDSVSRGAAAFYSGIHRVAISFLGFYGGQGRFDVRELPRVYDNDLPVGRDQSAKVPGSDVTISVVDINAAPEFETEGTRRDPSSVTYLAQSKSGTSRVESKPVGDVFRFDHSFEIEVKAISPTRAEFDVRAWGDFDRDLQRGQCSAVVEPR